MPQGHYGEYSGNHPRFSKKYDHAHTHVTGHNLDATKKDDEDHIDYLKQDINWDAKHGHSDEKMTADEKHITYLAEDEKYDEKHHSMAKNLGFASGVGKIEKRSTFDPTTITGPEDNPTVNFVATKPYEETGGGGMGSLAAGVDSNKTVQPVSDNAGSGGYDFTNAQQNAPSVQTPQGHGKTDFMKSRIDHLEKTGSNPAKLARLQGRLERTEMRQASRAERIADRNVRKKKRVEDWQNMRSMDSGKARTALNIMFRK